MGNVYTGIHVWSKMNYYFTITDTKFNLKAVQNCKALDSVNQWKELATELGLPGNELEKISTESKETQKSKSLDRWLKCDRKASWDKLVMALRKLEMHKVAASIWIRHMQSPTGIFTIV